ncbi:hypothetical protein, partial [Rudaea sp.]|uniref:hypothetical protein n=1 Tax=Rudaea sp. TaxID=2136325 RepID=UPI002ED56E43
RFHQAGQRRGEEGLALIEFPQVTAEIALRQSSLPFCIPQRLFSRMASPSGFFIARDFRGAVG